MGMIIQWAKLKTIIVLGGFLCQSGTESPFSLCLPTDHQGPATADDHRPKSPNASSNSYK